MNMEKAIAILAENGFKVTERRKVILTFFADDEKYKTAKSLYAHMEKLYPGISYDTVYRNLRLYHELGILEKTVLQAEKHYRMTCADHHHHHFICNVCGGTKKLNICPMDLEQIRRALSRCEINDHKFEVYGLCPDCKSA